MTERRRRRRRRRKVFSYRLDYDAMMSHGVIKTSEYARLKGCT